MKTRVAMARAKRRTGAFGFIGTSSLLGWSGTGAESTIRGYFSTSQILSWHCLYPFDLLIFSFLVFAFFRFFEFPTANSPNFVFSPFGESFFYLVV